MGQYDRKAQSQPKHGKPSSSGASKAGPPIPLHRPEWRGSGYIKKRTAPQQTTTSKETPVVQEHAVGKDLQQLLLNVFRSSFPALEDFEELKPVLHDINQAIVRGDLVAALDSEQRRGCYALRWPPGRSLAYANILCWINRQCEENRWFRSLSDRQTGRSCSTICFGESISAAMAWSGFLRHIRPDLAGKPLVQADAEISITSHEVPTLRLNLTDSIDWSLTLSRMNNILTQRPTLSKYASAGALASNKAFLTADALELAFHPVNILDVGIPDLTAMVKNTDPVMICFFHTLCDYFNTSMVQTTALLRALTALVLRESLIVVVDQVIATVSLPLGIGKEPQHIPMADLLDRLLLGKVHTKEEAAEARTEPKWTKIVGERLREHRIDDKLMYPASLENIRFQCLVYRRE